MTKLANLSGVGDIKFWTLRKLFGSKCGWIVHQATCVSLAHKNSISRVTSQVWAKYLIEEKN